MSTRRSTDVVPDVAKARARYETTRTLLFGLLVAIVLGFLALLLVMGHDLRQQQDQIAALAEENKREAAAVAELLARQQRADASRERLIDEAVAEIAAEQYRALVAHDHRTEDALNRALGLLDREVNAPANKEQPRVVIPLPRTVAPAPEPVPRPQTAPKPPPCEKRGNSGKCRK